METIQLETFLSVIEHKGFTRAAAALNCSQPTVSARIKNLEYELDCKLFDKDGKYVTLTKGGQLFVDYAKTILDHMNHSKEIIKNTTYHPIKIGFSPGFSYSFITELISSILLVDNIEVSIYEEKDSLRLNDQIISGELDLVFTRNSHTYKAEIVTELLFEDHFILICGKNHRFATMENITLEDLEGETLICYNRHTPLWSEIEQQLIGISNIKRIEVGNSEMVITVVEGGIGVGITPSLGLSNTDKKNLVSKKINNIEKIPNNVYVQYRQNSLTEPIVKRIIYSIINHEIRQSE